MSETPLVDDPLATLHDPLVRDLAWTLFSKPLLASASDAIDWPNHTDSLRHLQSLDTDPTPLHNAVMVQRSGRLGLYFEALWQFWLTDNPEYALVAHNLQVQTNGTTHGELDLIVRDRHSGELHHWELAVKFYLGIGDTSATSAWIGPNAQDRLDRKLRHFHDHQLPLLQRPETQTLLAEAGWAIQQQRLILKGRLFYPLAQTAPAPICAAAGHHRGWWVRREDFLNHVSMTSLQWQPLSRSQWLAPLRRESIDNLLTATELLRRFDADPQQPMCVAGFATGDECSRGFIVPPDWPTQS